MSKELQVEDDRRQWLLKGLCRFKDPSRFRDTQLSREAKGESPLTRCITIVESRNDDQQRLSDLDKRWVIISSFHCVFCYVC